MFCITVRLLLISLQISCVFQDPNYGCCVHNRFRFWRKPCSFHAAAFHRLSILSSRILVSLTCGIPHILCSSRCHHVYQNYSSSESEPFS